MSDQRKYRKHTPQQKLEVVVAGLRGDKTIREICREHDISENLYYQWRDNNIVRDSRELRSTAKGVCTLKTITRNADRARAMHDSNPVKLPDQYIKRIPDDFFVSGILISEDGGWTAVALDFAIAGSGATKAEAVNETLNLVNDYLIAGFDEGLDIEQLKRPAPEKFWRTYEDALSQELHELSDAPKDQVEAVRATQSGSRHFRQLLPC